MTDEWHELAAGELPRLQLEKLPAYGFQHEGKSYLYEEVLLDGAFLLQIKVAASGKAATRLLDRESQEPYVLHLIESAAGAFVWSVKDAYRKALNRLGEACGEHGTFSGSYIQQILDYIRDTYGDEIEYPWKDDTAAVIRSHLSRKWYVLFMEILPEKIGLGGQKPIRVMNLHGTAEQVAALVDGSRYFPGYHMNRKYWYTLCLDGSVPMEELQQRIAESFRLSQPKKKKAGVVDENG